MESQPQNPDSAIIGILKPMDRWCSNMNDSINKRLMELTRQATNCVIVPKKQL